MTRDIHPDGLPHAYTIILMFRLLPDSPTEAFDIWQVSTSDHKPETGVTLNRKYLLCPYPLLCVLLEDVTVWLMCEDMRSSWASLCRICSWTELSGV